MSTTRALKVLALPIALAALASHAAADGACSCAACRGLDSQSPIDIQSEHLTFATLPELQFDYSTSANLGVVNNGSPGEFATILSLPSLGDGRLSLGGVDYNLVNIHFHVGSEHQLNGEEFDMEMHMVHQDANGNLLVVGRWIEAGAFNAALDPIFSNLPDEPNVGNPIGVSGFDLSALLPEELFSVRYSGSLTTPPFSEPVQWIVLTEVLELGLDQILAFEEIFPDGNFREPQPLNDRVVFTDDVRLVPTPATAALLAGGGLFAARRRRVNA